MCVMCRHLPLKCNTVCKWNGTLPQNKSVSHDVLQKIENVRPPHSASSCLRHVSSPCPPKCKLVTKQNCTLCDELPVRIANYMSQCSSFSSLSKKKTAECLLSRQKDKKKSRPPVVPDCPEVSVRSTGYRMDTFPECADTRPRPRRPLRTRGRHCNILMAGVTFAMSPGTTVEGWRFIPHFKICGRPVHEQDVQVATQKHPGQRAVEATGENPAPDVH